MGKNIVQEIKKYKAEDINKYGNCQGTSSSHFLVKTGTIYGIELLITMMDGLNIDANVYKYVNDTPISLAIPINDPTNTKIQTELDKLIEWTKQNIM
jgi:hypothetical protein